MSFEDESREDGVGVTESPSSGAQLAGELQAIHSEHGENDQELYAKLIKMVSPEGVSDLIAQTESALHQEKYLEIGALFDEENQVSRLFEEGKIDGPTFGERTDNIRRQLNSEHDSADVHAYRRLLHQLGELKRGRVVLEDRFGDDAAKLVISEATNSNARSPHGFIRSEILQSAAKGTGEFIAFSQHEARIPIGMFVSAVTFESWNGRSGDNSKGGVSSREVINRYAGMDTPIPPLDDISAYVLPDGKTVLSSNNSHRVAAAIKRGDESIPFKGRMFVHILDEVPAALLPESEQA